MGLVLCLPVRFSPFLFQGLQLHRCVPIRKCIPLPFSSTPRKMNSASTTDGDPLLNSTPAQVVQYSHRHHFLSSFCRPQGSHRDLTTVKEIDAFRHHFSTHFLPFSDAAHEMKTMAKLFFTHRRIFFSLHRKQNDCTKKNPNSLYTFSFPHY